MAKKGIKEAMRAANREGGKGIQPALAAIVGLGKTPLSLLLLLSYHYPKNILGSV
jgi:hypothetical protein